METTLIILKPDSVQRGLIGQVIGRFEAKGLQIVGAKLMQIHPDLARKHYAVHEGKPFYGKLIRFMTSAPVLVLAIRGRNAIGISRKMIGATSGSQADPGTIRGDFGISDSFNLIHGSDTPESAKQELTLFFTPDELLDYDRTIDPWVYDLLTEQTA